MPSSRPSSQGRARNCRPAGSADWHTSRTYPMGTVIAGAPVGGAICGELFPAHKNSLWQVSENAGQLAVLTGS